MRVPHFSVLPRIAHGYLGQVSQSPTVGESNGDLRSVERRGRETLAEPKAERRGRETLAEPKAERRGRETLAERNKFATKAAGIRWRPRPTLQHARGRVRRRFRIHQPGPSGP